MAKIRDATSTDVPAIVALHASVAAEGRWIGTEAPVDAAVEWARGREAVHKLELEVWPHNTAALALYTRTGFEVEGRRRRQYRRRTGELWDSIVMGLVLDHTSPGSPHPDND